MPSTGCKGKEGNHLVNYSNMNEGMKDIWTWYWYKFRATFTYFINPIIYHMINCFNQSCFIRISKQAWLSRATLEISSEFSSNFPLRTHKSHSVHFEVIFPSEVIFILRISKIWINHLSLSFKFSGYWDIPLFRFWDRFPLEFIFILSICKFWFGHLEITLKF